MRYNLLGCSQIKRDIYQTRNNVNAANDKGPIRYVATYGIDVREMADHFGIDEDSMREFLIKHEGEILSAMKQAALEKVGDLGFLEAFFPMGDLEDAR